MALHKAASPECSLHSRAERAGRIGDSGHVGEAARTIEEVAIERRGGGAAAAGRIPRQTRSFHVPREFRFGNFFSAEV